VARAVRAYNIVAKDAQPDAGMAERALAPVAGNRALGDMDDFGRDAGLWDVGHAFLGGFSIAPMIAMRPMLSKKLPDAAAVARGVVLALATALAGCAGYIGIRTGPLADGSGVPATVQDGEVVMADGARLPYRVWSPPGPARAVVLALHGFNDSRDAWELPAPRFADGGIAVVAPDQRGFGAAPRRGYWPGTDAMVRDAATMAAVVKRRYPDTPLYLMGESMGAAVLMCLAASAHPPPAAGYVLIAPAVWGRAEMNVFLRASLWLFSNLLPGLEVTGGFADVRPSDNRDALRRLSTDPLSIHETRLDAVRGLVDLMDSALASAPALRGRTLILYGGHDELVPEEATVAAWRALPASVLRGFYPGGYHLLLRDREREVPTSDVIAWIEHPNEPLPSGAEGAAAAWLAAQSPTPTPPPTTAHAQSPLPPARVSRYAENTDP